jgi:hypothetical protein
LNETSVCEPECPKKTTDPSQVTDKLYHIITREHVLYIGYFVRNVLLKSLGPKYRSKWTKKFIEIRIFYFSVTETDTVTSGPF